MFPPIPKKAEEEQDFELPGDIAGPSAPSPAVDDVVAMRREYVKQQASQRPAPQGLLAAPQAPAAPQVPTPPRFPDLEVYPLKLEEFNIADIRISVS